ncbi:TPA: hypothetical protein ACGPA6_002152 [Streptococcus suis]|nr:hypothetical protein [Streptococcus suis]HEM4142642.1 hypothetical protein [Streptococcus suis]HEP1788660.1 hypothetical protein [Streptococcus suis]
MSKYNFDKFGDNKKIISARISPELHRELKIYSATQGMTVSEALATAIVTELISVGQLSEEDVK